MDCSHNSKTCFKWPLKIDKTKILMTNGSLMKVARIAECEGSIPQGEHSAKLLTFIKRLSALKTNIGPLFELLLKTGFTV